MDLGPNLPTVEHNQTQQQRETESWTPLSEPLVLHFQYCFFFLLTSVGEGFWYCKRGWSDRHLLHQTQNSIGAAPHLQPPARLLNGNWLFFIITSGQETCPDLFCCILLEAPSCDRLHPAPAYIHSPIQPVCGLETGPRCLLWCGMRRGRQPRDGEAGKEGRR